MTITGMLSVILLWLSATEAQSTLRISPPGAVPANASAIINPSFAGFGIEPSNLFSFTGYDTPNPLTFNLINNLVNYTGLPPHLRIGGNTQDYMVFSADQNNYTWINNPRSTGQGNYASDSQLIGPKFFEVANRFPRGTPVTWGLNLAYQASDYETRLVTMAQQLVKGIPNLKLVSIEIGNEPDLYLQNGFRTGAWGGQVYLQQWSNRAQFLWDQVLKPLGLPSNFFEPGATASTIGTSFMITDLFQMGAATKANGSDTTFVSSTNQHDYYYYIGVSTYALTLQRFMTLSTTEDQFAAWTTQVQQATTAGYPYALREMCSVGPIGYEGITNTFGAALWTLNFFLYGATLNISSIQMHQTDNSNASAWQPLEMYNRQPFVRPSYYAWAAFDQIIGPSCQAQVAPLDVSSALSGYADTVRAYSIYQAGKIATIVIINAQLANSSSTTKSNLTVQLSLPSAAGQVLHLAYLTNAGADATFNTTWNGISYEQTGNGLPTTVDNADQTVTVASDGSATLTVRDSQALAANIGSKVGSGTANSAACAAIASKSPGLGPSSTVQANSVSASSTASADSQQQSGSATRSAAGSDSTAAAKNQSSLPLVVDAGLGSAALLMLLLVFM
ncbi:glycoside hydrolase family 79 protein [Myriangium duriaei CBS 260.36]|uniref:Glycoside hydrolase family 79 protein n=1 Tax=Myriangium duriaei CBS 260.36 TaxID=1168546 RepID=A0A9P4J168_9PEZI|nr:glycoside hydrolase family 79 protein [Myriangium duriaei CBS 260.36]